LSYRTVASQVYKVKIPSIRDTRMYVVSYNIDCSTGSVEYCLWQPYLQTGFPKISMRFDNGKFHQSMSTCSSFSYTRITMADNLHEDLNIFRSDKQNVYRSEKIHIWSKICRGKFNANFFLPQALLPSWW
jgi:hypothetical protein